MIVKGNCFIGFKSDVRNLSQIDRFSLKGQFHVYMTYTLFTLV